MIKGVKSPKVEGRRSAMLYSCFLCLFVATSGCKEETKKHSSLSEPVLSRQYRQGSATVIISVSETNITTSGKIILMLDVHAPEHDIVVFPEIGTHIEPFTIADRYSEPAQTLPNHKQLHRQTWTLIPALPGIAIFQPLEICAGNTTIQTKPISISTTSLLPTGLTDLEIKDIADPVLLLPKQEKQQALWNIILGVIVSVALLLLGIRRIRKPQIIPTLSPCEITFQSLETLPAQPLEKIHALTEILITYIGDHFELPTIGKTIPEIIPLLPKEQLLGRREPLENYLVTSEQIRFSHRIPDGFADELEHYIHTFIKETTREIPCD